VYMTPCWAFNPVPRAMLSNTKMTVVIVILFIMDTILVDQFLIICLSSFVGHYPLYKVVKHLLLKFTHTDMQAGGQGAQIQGNLLQPQQSKYFHIDLLSKISKPLSLFHNLNDAFQSMSLLKLFEPLPRLGIVASYFGQDQGIHIRVLVPHKMRQFYKVFDDIVFFLGNFVQLAFMLFQKSRKRFIDQLAFVLKLLINGLLGDPRFPGYVIHGDSPNPAFSKKGRSHFNYFVLQFHIVWLNLK